MTIQSCTFTIHFPPNQKVREHLFDLEKHFTDFQSPFTLVSLPPDAPHNLPRIIAASKHQHSQLVICGNSAQLITNFDDKFNRDIKKCIEYIQLKCESIVSSLSIINENAEEPPRFYFSGLSVTLNFDSSDNISNPIEYINSNFLKCKLDVPTDEVQFRVALVVEEKYYVNISMQNHRIFSGAPDERGSFAGLKKNDHLQVVVDINDRYIFNHEKNYFSSNEAVAHIAKLAEDFISMHVAGFVENGEITYNE